MNAPEQLPVEKSQHPESSPFSPQHARVGADVVHARVTATANGWEVRTKSGYVTSYYLSLGHVVFRVQFQNERDPVAYQQHDWYGLERTYTRHHDGLALAKHKDDLVDTLKKKIWARLKVECAGIAEVMNACKEGMP